MSWNTGREVGSTDVSCDDEREMIASDNSLARILGFSYRSIFVGAAVAIFAAVGITINPGTF